MIYLYVHHLPVFVLQVSFRTSDHRQSFTVEVCVIDKNDNVPVFIADSMRGSVQLGLLKGMRTLSFDVTIFHKVPESEPHSTMLPHKNICSVLPKQRKTWLIQLNWLLLKCICTKNDYFVQTCLQGSLLNYNYIITFWANQALCGCPIV